MASLSPSTSQALAHLREIKPRDGWSVEQNAKDRIVRLLRRNVPLTDNFFLDLHYSPEHRCVVGVLSVARNGTATGQVLVDRSGSVLGRRSKLVTITSWRKEQPQARAPQQQARASGNAGVRSAPPSGAVTNAENKEIGKYFLYAIVGAIVMNALSRALATLTLVAVPVLYFYGLQTCPPASSFDAKKELKRVLRGHHLPEDNPNKPKGFLDETLARINATVTTEIATLAGFEVEMMSLGGAAFFTTVRIPATKVECFWIGAFGSWHFLFNREYEPR